MSAALAEQRLARKKTQEDVKLLANRIALLKLEEKKVSIFLRQKWRIQDLQPLCFYSRNYSVTCMYIYFLGLEKNRRNKKEGQRYYSSETTKRRIVQTKRYAKTAARK